MKVPRALGRLVLRIGRRPTAGLLARRATGLVALVPLLLAGLVPVASAAPDTGDSGGSGGGSASQADGPAPVQVLDLTGSSGQATEIARSGLDDAQSGTGAGGGGAGGGTGAATSVSPALAASVSRSVQRTVAQTTGGTTGRVPMILPTATDPQIDATLLTDPLEVDRFLVAGFTWTGGADLPEGVRIYLRVRENGTWSPWYLNEAADSGRDDRATSGTGEFVTGGADAIQASVVGGSLPTDLKLALVPSQPQGEQALSAADLKTTEAGPTPVIEDAAVPQTAPGWPGASKGSTEPVTQPAAAGATPLVRPATFTTTALPPVRPAALPATVPAALPAATTANGLPVPVTTRAEWGANASYMTWDPEYASAGHVVVHHTAGTNNYSAEQSASIVRGIYYYHAVTLDWGDIGYNFLIDKFGTVFEGRSGSLAAPGGRMSVGAHARGVNTGTMGLSMMGDYSSVSPSEAQLSSVGKMAGWFLRRAGISDANGWAGLHVWTTERYQAGSTVSMPRILAHRDVGYTSCPGDVGYSKLGIIRSIAQAQIDGSGTWKAESGSWYYIRPDGARATGWVLDSGSWYYLDGSRGGAMVTGWVADAGSWYYLDGSRGGAMATGWVLDAGSWYYLGSDGALSTGWVADAGNWYYLDGSRGGAMVTGRARIEGRWSTFAGGGAWQGYETLHPVLATPTASRQQVIATMVSTYNGSGRAYPSSALSEGGAATAQDFFTTLYDEAVSEGVSPELLFAQVMKETAWLQFGGDVRIQQFNFGGLGATGGGAAGASFPSVQIGLRAQVQHLRAYADSGASAQDLSHPLVDTRFAYVRKGSAPYVEHLGIQENPQRTGWATARNYGNDLAAMIDQYFG